MAEVKLSATKHQVSPPLKEGPTKVEVSNVPDVREEVLKTFFEGSKGGGCAGAVADVTKISSKVFHVTFHDPNGTCPKVHCTLYILLHCSILNTLITSYYMNMSVYRHFTSDTLLYNLLYPIVIIL